jgi:hypothetical protein
MISGAAAGATIPVGHLAAGGGLLSVHVAVFFRRHHAFAVGADVQPLSMQFVPGPVGLAGLGARQAGIRLRLRRPAIDRVGILFIGLQAGQGDIETSTAPRRARPPPPSTASPLRISAWPSHPGPGILPWVPPPDRRENTVIYPALGDPGDAVARTGERHGNQKVQLCCPA